MDGIEILFLEKLIVYCEMTACLTGFTEVYKTQ